MNEHEGYAQAFAALLREGLGFFVGKRFLPEEERVWIERAQQALADWDAPPSSPAWRYVGCNCGATVREFADGTRYDADDRPHRCRLSSEHARRAALRADAIEREVEALLMRAYREARMSSGGALPWEGPLC